MIINGLIALRTIAHDTLNSAANHPWARRPLVLFNGRVLGEGMMPCWHVMELNCLWYGTSVWLEEVKIHLCRRCNTRTTRQDPGLGDQMPLPLSWDMYWFPRSRGRNSNVGRGLPRLQCERGSVILNLRLAVFHRRFGPSHEAFLWMSREPQGGPPIPVHDKCYLADNVPFYNRDLLT